jgi:hypothetical protein
VLVLEFPSMYSFHAESCATETSQQIIGEVVESVLGIRPRLECLLADGDARTPPPVAEADGPATSRTDAEDVMETEAAEQAGELPDETEAHERALETLTRDLGAKVLDDGDA